MCHPSFVFDIYLVNVKRMAQIFVAISEKLNFKARFLEICMTHSYQDHPIQKLRENLDKYPRTFDSCFLSYMMETYIKTLKK